MNAQRVELSSGEGLSRTKEYGAVTRGQTFVYAPEDIVMITDPGHELYEPSVLREPSEEFIASVMEFGVLEPVIVRRNGTKADGTAVVELVDGRMRIKAARIANKRRLAVGKDPIFVEAKLVRGLKNGRAESVMIHLNTQRRVEDLVTMAELLRRYLAHGHTEAEARVAFPGKSRGYKVLCEVMEMNDALKTALASHKITLDAARRLSCLPEQKQAEALDQLLTLSKGKTRGAVAQKALDQAAPNTPRRPAKPKLRSRAVVLKAIDGAALMARTDYQKGVLDALEWLLGKKECAWADPKPAGTSDKK